MKQTLRHCLVIGLCSTWLSSATAAEDNIEQMRKLYAYLADHIAVDVPALSRVGTRLVLAPAGGYLVDPRLAPDSNPDDRRVLIGNFMDVRIAESWILGKRPDPMSSIYRAVLRDSITPRFSLSEAQRKEYENLDQELYYQRPRRPSQLLSDYQSAADKLVPLLQAAQTFQRNHPGRPLPASLEAQLRRARQEYENGAVGPTVREMLRRHTELQRLRGSGWLSDLQELFEANYNSEGGLGNVDWYPTYSTWLDTNQTWTRISIAKNDLDRQTHNRDTSFSGGLSAGWGLFRIGGSYQKDETLRYVQSTNTGLTLSFEVLLVNLRFPWMNVGIFDSKAWDWSPSALYANTLISDGEYNPQAQDQAGHRPEILSQIPTTIIIARNVKLAATWSFDMNKFVSERTAAGGSFGWGPFSLGGRTRTTDERTHAIAQLSGTELSFSSPQIIGYFTYMPGLSPDRDPNLPWTDRADRSMALVGPDDLLKAVDKVLEANP
jgi:hypothetical protein